MYRKANCTDSLSLDQRARLRPVSSGNAAKGVARRLVSLFETFCEWQQRAEIRQRMALLDEALLDDMGLSREQVDAEARKPFWKK